MTKKAYWVARVEVTNMEAYQGYVAKNAAAFKKFGARFIVRGGPFEMLEGGGAKSRNVVIEFPNLQAARDCWHSPEYQEAIAERKGAALVDLMLIEGYDGPQPA